MKRHILILADPLVRIKQAVVAQIDLENFDLKNLDLKDLIGKVMKVEKGFAPNFFLGNA